MRAEHFEILVEEPSMEAFLLELLPRLIGTRSTFTIHTHQGKMDLLDKLRARLQGYAKWLPTNARIVVLVDRDDDDCAALKEQLECDSAAAGLVTRGGGGDAVWRVVNRIAIEELEAWFFGEWAGVRKAYPRAAANVPNQAPYRHCDAIAGGTWEALERVLKRGGYFSGGLRKVEAAREIGKHLDHAACTSPSFAAFRDALIEASA
jgi:hypothetical protein